MLAAAGIGAGRVTCDQIVDLEPILDGLNALFQAACGLHLCASILLALELPEHFGRFIEHGSSRASKRVACVRLLALALPLQLIQNG
jgi:hypothetical protein